MQQYFINNIEDNTIHLSKEDQHHVKKVMRFKEGDQVICVDSSRQMYLCSFISVDEGTLKIDQMIDSSRELDIEVTLIYSLPKGDKFELVLQKATELGVHRIVPMLSKRCIVRTNPMKFEKKMERYKRIAKEASEQCHRNMIPEIMNVISVKDIRDYLGDYNVVAYEEMARKENHHQFHHILKQLKADQSITIVVGPEGGFEVDEIETMKQIGVIPCSLGKRILRSETAPLYMLSIIGYSREIALWD